MNYISLIIDVEESRKYDNDDRNHIQKFMLSCVDNLNELLKKSQEFPVMFSAGDEVQGLFRDLTAAILYLRLFEILVYPVKIRAGIGVGEWNVKINEGLSTQQDGPAYHRARQALMETRKMQTQRYRIHSEYPDELANNLINISGVLKEQQGIQQNLALLIMEFLYPFEKTGVIHYRPDLLRTLLELKYSRKQNEGNRDEANNKIDRKLIEIIESIMIDGKNYRTEEIISKKNLSNNIAAIMGCKRQNVDKLIKRGNSLAIRSMDYTALQYIESGMG